MSRRAGIVRRIGAAGVANLAEPNQARPLSDELGELEPSADIALPRDHPRWVRDRFTVSAATKALVDKIKPLAIRVFGFWDHRIHRLALGDATIEIDACGSYRCQ